MDFVPHNELGNHSSLEGKKPSRKKNIFIYIVISTAIIALVLFFVALTHRNSSRTSPAPLVNGEQQGTTGIALDDFVISDNATYIDTAPTTTVVGLNDASYCNSGRSDDYDHVERFFDESGNVICENGVVIFDHQITPKFIRTIIPYITEETGTIVNLDDIDFYITLPETGEQVVYQDIFNWYDASGHRTVFNTNQLLWDKWAPYLKDTSTHQFYVKMIHRPTGANISLIFKDHTTMTLYFKGYQ